MSFFNSGLRLPYFKQYLTHSNCIIQITYPRSGTVWLSSIVNMLIHENICNIFAAPSEIPKKTYYIITHDKDAALLSDNKCIFLVRDPRDAIQSFILFGQKLRHTHNRTPLLINKEMYKSYAKEWKKYFVPVFFDSNILIIQYEHLCLDLPSMCKKLAMFIGDTLTLYKPLNKSIQQVIKQCKWQTGQEYYEHHCLKYKREPIGVGTELEDTVWDICKDQMIMLGYNKDGHSKLLFNSL